MFFMKRFILVLPVLLAAQEVQGLFQAEKKLPDAFGNGNGLIGRTINSQRPTSPRPTEPTESPTESPAPSPSPSMAPSADPKRITGAPTGYPTESPAPSPSPSSTPSSAPTKSPSESPSASPTVSPAPSASPSASPSDAPSASPSVSPSASPTISAAPSASPTISMEPSASPSASPTDQPSASPSDAPSMSPTAITDRTKTAVSSLLLEQIGTEMDALTMAEFELFTLDFLRKKMPLQDTHVLNMLAVTVLTQNLMYPDLSTTAPNRTVFGKRSLESESWDVALEVEIRTVGVVTEGRVPKGFNFTQDVLLTFYNHWDQYLYQLGSNLEFFKPLVEISDWVPPPNEEKQGKEKGKGAFAAAVLFSFAGFGTAVYASYIAIQKHLNRNEMTPHKSRTNRKSFGTPFSPKNSPLNYSGADVINYLTQTMSDDNGSPKAQYHDGDIEGGGAINFITRVDVEDHGLESIALTPRAASPSAAIRNGLFVVDEGSDDDQSPLKSPIARSPVAPKSSSKIGQIKKWLTPRGLGFGTASEVNRRLSSSADPPEHESTTGFNYGKEHMDPDALKASTKNATGIFTTDTSTVGGQSKATGISYKKPPTRPPMRPPPSNDVEEGQFTLPVSFFSNRVDPNNPESPMSSLADSNIEFGNTSKQSVPVEGTEEEGHEVSNLKKVSPKMTLQPANTPASIMRPTPELLKNLEGPTDTKENKAPVDSPQSAVKIAVKRFEERQVPKPPDSTIGIETILGARSRDSADDEDEEDKRSNVSASFLQSRSIFSPNMRKDRKTPTTSSQYTKVDVQVQEQQEEARSGISGSTLGARRMIQAEDVSDDRTTLSTVMRRSGCYHVYAPSGPIGIVVDTSKDGPSVHSLKATSPMLGLITPGDLIVALDDEDTRNMTAAALTRLMARKSRQKERKITLYS